MKVIKPQTAGLLTRSYEHDRRFFLSLGVLTFHRFEGALSTETAMWPFLAAELGGDAPETGMPKARAEYLVCGAAYPPTGTAEPSCAVQVRVGALEKTLWVYGDRYWYADDALGEAISPPEPFEQMPLTWEAAFGGPDFERNPVGKGHGPVELDNVSAHPLPNVELPATPIRTRTDRPEPAGFGAIDLLWPQRADKAGTYDDHWTEHLSPGLAHDIDWSWCNVAPEDQQQDQPWRGDEEFHIYGMHPRKPRVGGRLTGLTARCFLSSRTDEGESFSPVPMALTTIWLFPHAERYVLVHHGLQEVAEEDGADVLQAVVALERIGAPRSESHYREVLRKRLDPDRGALHSLREQDLIPELEAGEAESDSEADAEKALREAPGLRKQAQRRRQEREIEKARAAVAAQGLDPDVHGPPPLSPEPPPDDPAQLAEVIDEIEREAKEREKAHEARQEKQEAELRTRLALDGVDADAYIEKMKRPPAGPPGFRAEAEVAMLRARQGERRMLGLPLDHLDRVAIDPELQQGLFEAEERFREGYRANAHHQGPAARLDDEQAALARADALDVLARLGHLARADLTGFDLSGLDLSGVNLEGAWLENADLTGTRLAGANLAGAVLARADLTDTDLTDADLAGANLGHALLVRTTAPRTNLAGCVLVGTLLDDADLRHSILGSAELEETVIRATDLSGADLGEVLLHRIDLTGARLVGATLDRAALLEVDLRGVDLTGASLEGATFVSAALEGAIMSGANLTGARLVQGCRLTGADLREATLARNNLRGADLTGADLSGADLTGADLSECTLTRSRLVGARARGALFIESVLTEADLTSASLMEALLQRANLAAATLRDTNLFGADLSRAALDSATSMDGANLKRARLTPARRPDDA